MSMQLYTTYIDILYVFTLRDVRCHPIFSQSPGALGSESRDGCGGLLELISLLNLNWFQLK